MSNRRKLKSEKAKRVRCPRCKGRSFMEKYLGEGTYALICNACEYIVKRAFVPDDVNKPADV